MQRNKDISKLMNEYGKKGIPFLFVIDFDNSAPEVFMIEELRDKGIFADIGNLQIYPEKSELPQDIIFQKIPVSFQRYKQAFETAKDYIFRGDSFLLNLTFPTEIVTNLSLKDIFIHSRAKFKLLYKDRFTVFSPEPFIRISGNKISSFPMKGTIDASLQDAGKKIMEDIKEISEHNTIVDLIRNDLSMVAKRVRVDKFRYIEKVKTHEKELLQTSSEISGILPGDRQQNIGDIIFRMLPAGSISGAPKKMTIQIIKEAEKYERGFFTGIFGYFDGKNLESAVMIRFIEKEGDKMIFKSGGGITYFSNVEDEYNELIDKVYVPIVRNSKD
jgi:para-aminobenzoate synthetase component 1